MSSLSPGGDHGTLRQGVERWKVRQLRAERVAEAVERRKRPSIVQRAHGSVLCPGARFARAEEAQDSLTNSTIQAAATGSVGWPYKQQGAALLRWRWWRPRLCWWHRCRNGAGSGRSWGGSSSGARRSHWGGSGAEAEAPAEAVQRWRLEGWLCTADERGALGCVREKGVPGAAAFWF
eukprot:6214725-Pleurochrysis_carterae.AAC.8